jgi:hypothetical protein
MSRTTDEAAAQWLHDAETRHLADLTFAEVSRALRALSSTYVERRGTLAKGSALSGAGKRAAFALFYAPLHFLLIKHIVSQMPAARALHGAIVDLGCGTGAAGAAWSISCDRPLEVVGVDRHPWAVDEARRTYRAFGVRARVRVDDLARVELPARSSVLAAFTVNELDAGARDLLLDRLLAHAKSRGRVLVVEPLAGFVAPWWGAWRDAFESRGGQAAEWRFHSPLPPIVTKLDRAAGLNHRELTARSLWLA